SKIPLAGLRYTFIGEPGQRPVSLRQALLAEPDPALLEKLFRTFGPNWWMQRRPYTFRLAQEYDRKLPSHYTLEPAAGKGVLFDGRVGPEEVGWQVGDVVTLRHFRVVERKADGQLSLRGETQSGQPPLRLRWLSPADPEGATARVVATRDSLLKEWTAEFDKSVFDCHGLPEPLAALPGLLNETVSGTQSTIHGDLNLENILVGPGGLVWLIDFANTRDGHTLFDFAHLAAEIIAHVLVLPPVSAEGYVPLLLEEEGGLLLRTLREIAGRCLFNSDRPREFDLALALSCLGALKHSNLDAAARWRLYIAAGWAIQF
ncbi:MAG: aminoglycoside phosphotransferase family protein, partial [Chloroflexi bacterium]|nr:aminoglycoside phosphotransferase family protein [Chloroflexota bacterium]MCI0649876.1 aminoglycoside phosphotransferase family protein [Chloroflexota bacterium]MCI0725646.1 aminoglycoside phosphotransferase family protein [Chloroflexota bacterium]